MIYLPLLLQQQIKELIAPFKNLEQGYQSLSKKYRANQQHYLDGRLEVMAYTAARLPATFAAITAICQDTTWPSPVTSITDLGSGPGTALCALSQVWPITHADVIEHNPAFVCVNKVLNSIKNTRYTLNSLDNMRLFPANDAVIMSYTLNELKNTESVIKKAWQAANKYLILIEPGTPAGFANIKKARSQLIELGGHIMAPCTHSEICPMTDKDWCHFSVRLARPTFHKLAKGATLEYEDEKYTYLIVSKAPVCLINARIIKKPQIHQKHLKLDLCSKEGLSSQIITKSNKELYQKAKKSSWHDIWSL